MAQEHTLPGVIKQIVNCSRLKLLHTCEHVTQQFLSPDEWAASSSACLQPRFLKWQKGHLQKDTQTLYKNKHLTFTQQATGHWKALLND